MREGLAEAGAEDAVDRRQILGGRVAIGDGHAKPAGAGHSGEWMATTLNSLPI